MQYPLPASRPWRAAALAVALSAAAALPAAALAATAPASPSASPAASAAGNPQAPADKEFFEKAAVGGMTEVSLGSMAAKRAHAAAVRSFGQRMVRDHTTSNQQLGQVAKSKGWELPTGLDDEHQQVVDRMSKLTPEQFDQEYMQYMVADHKQDIEDFQKESNGGQDIALRSFAAKTLPVLKRHLLLAQTTNTAVNKLQSSGSK